MTAIDLHDCPIEELEVAARHFEDLDIFVGQRSRLHPGPGWAITLAMIRSNLADVRAEIVERQIAGRQIAGRFGLPGA